MKMLFDLDHTLADSSHRERFIDGSLGHEHWDAFYSEEQVLMDRSIAPIVQICTDLWLSTEGVAPRHSIRFLTGRDERARKPTVQWLRTALSLGPFFVERNSHEWLLMRALDDYRPNDEYKASQIDALIEAGWVPDVAFDDDERMAAVLRDRGIAFLNVRR